ncbi:DUF6461 domain-containing protein [Streptomyces decoyicus]|uniref:DUF6461 domain-containing protein n=1 Tax=Streptomyces decoyicus TaxID=249567 RepID=UPI002E37DAE7|nr:DUF6461 domain-containing protein [Streptomyces decoyicus]
MTDMNPLAWIADAYETHCLTLAKGLTGHELLLRLGADPAETFTPLDDDEANGFLWAAGENYWSWGAARAGEAKGWAFVLEPASCWGNIPERLEHASRGTEVIFSSEVGGMGNVGYWQDGTRITGFDTMTPQDRAEQGQAADPDRLVEQMQRAGLFVGPGALWQRYGGLALLYEVTGLSVSQEQTALALSGKLPALGLGREGRRQRSDGRLASSSRPDAEGGAVGDPSGPQPAGRAKISRGAGALPES